MRWIFLAPFVVLCNFCLGQVSTVSLSFPGDQDGVYVEDPPIFDEFADGFSACAWFKVDSGIVNTSVAYAKPIFTKHFRIPLDENIGFDLKGWFYQGSQNLASEIGTTHQNASIGCEDCLLYDVWQHACVRLNSDEYALFLDGVKVDSLMLNPGEIYVDNDDAFQIGYRQDWNAGDDYYNWKGEIQEVAVWSRPIGDTEISDLLSCSPSHLGADLVGYWPLNEGNGNIVSDHSGNSLHGSILGDVAWEIEEIYSSCPFEELGCPDITACNYNAEITANDGSCTYPGCNDSLACNFDAFAGCDDGSCDYTCCPGPGCCDTGTTWDYEIEKCVPINSCPEDLNYDGIIGVEDLLSLLSSFGTPCDPPVDPPVAEWTCGDPVSYHGYDYETVLIGEQCWFAENLRTEFYQNGDVINEPLDDSEWQSTEAGAQTIYDNDLSNLDLYGRLYNFFAVNDARNCCPGGWYVPSDFQWQALEQQLGMEGSDLEGMGFWRGTEQELGQKLKSAEFWNGSNETGFSGLPSGIRNAQGVYVNETVSNSWWCDDLFEENDSGLFRSLTTGNGGIMRFAAPLNRGASIRCIKD